MEPSYVEKVKKILLKIEWMTLSPASFSVSFMEFWQLEAIHASRSSMVPLKRAIVYFTARQFLVNYGILPPSQTSNILPLTLNSNYLNPDPNPNFLLSTYLV